MHTIGAPPRTEAQESGRLSPHRIGRWAAVLVGLVAVGITLTLAELLAAAGAWLGLFDPAASPFRSLGAAFIAITPEWLKDLGISLFGQSDKAALAVVMVVTFLVVAVIIGLVGRLTAVGGAVIGGALAAVTGAAILGRPATGVGELIPLLVGTIAGIGFLVHLLRLPADPYWEMGAVGSRPSRSTAVPDIPGEPAARDDSGIAAGSPARRAVLRATGIGALVAVVAGALSRLVPNVADIQADRAAVRLPPLTDPTADSASADSASADRASAGPASAGPPSTAAAPAQAAPAGARIASLPPLPAGVNPAVAGLTPFVTAADHFYRVDTAFTLPRVTTEAWTLRVHGLVDQPLRITWTDLLGMAQVQRWLTLTCVSNEVGGDLVGNAAWQGVRIADLLARAMPQRGADCVLSTSADGFTVTTPLDALTDGRDALLAFGMNGEPLPIEHGFPVRMVVPGLYGYVSATKWVVDLEVTRFADVAAYWTERGWAPRGPVKTASRIDTPGYDVTVGPGTVPVAGVAWAQHRGISGVDVQVDDGPWRAASLAGATSDDTWRQWVFRWDTTEVAVGEHTLRCRAIDGTGAVQDGEQRSVIPDGATGYHSVPVVVRRS